jgi:hypothetical protein
MRLMQMQLRSGPRMMKECPWKRSEAMPYSGWNIAELIDAIEASPLAIVRERESLSMRSGRMGAKKLP